MGAEFELIACERSTLADVDSSLSHERAKSASTDYHPVHQRNRHSNSERSNSTISSRDVDDQ